MTGDLFIGNDNTIELDGLYDNVSAGYVNDATLSLVIRDLEGTLISTVSMSYVATTNGNYRGNIEEDIVIVAGEVYALTITATASGDRVGSWRAQKSAKYRT